MDLSDSDLGPVSRDWHWRTSSLCAEGATCVQVYATKSGAHIRDGKEVNSEGFAPYQSYTVAEWRAFVAAVKAGEFDI